MTKQILVMGGTGFLGPHIVEKLVSHGHQVTLFNRGETNGHLFPDLDKLIGDRLLSDLRAIEGQTYDAVVDINAYVPRVVRELLETVKAEHYVFVSTISVYPEFAKVGLNESDDVASTVGFETDETITGESYGPLKVLCERKAERATTLTILRPGLVVGPLDPTDRFTYWVARGASAEAFIAPGRPDDPIQYIDVRDFAEFTARCVEHKIDGTYNVVVPGNHATIGEVIAHAGGQDHAVWVDDDQIAQFDLKPWGDLPAWVSPRGEMRGLTAVSSEAAIAKGLSFRSVGTTIRDTLAWHQETNHQLKTGLDEARIAEILTKLGD